MAFHPGLPEGGKWILSSACCSWNCKHSMSRPPPGLPSLRFQSMAQTWGGVRGGSHFPTTTSPAPWELRAEGEKTGQRREGQQPSSSSAPLLTGYCSQTETVKPCQAQIHSESPTSAFLECVTAGFTSSGPQFNNMSSSFSLTSAKTLSPPPRLCIRGTRALWLSKYLSGAKGRPISSE